MTGATFGGGEPVDWEAPIMVLSPSADSGVVTAAGLCPSYPGMEFDSPRRQPLCGTSCLGGRTAWDVHWMAPPNDTGRCTISIGLAGETRVAPAGGPRSVVSVSVVSARRRTAGARRGSGTTLMPSGIVLRAAAAVHVRVCGCVCVCVCV